MNLTVDASVVIKWFVAEPMRDEARLVLSHRVNLYAPEFVVAEFGNAIWKKARRKEIPDPGPYLQEIPALPNIIDLYSIASLAERAAQIAFELDHPIYDCLYLACADVTGPDLLTADRRFADKAAGRFSRARVHYLGGGGVADWLAKEAASPVIEKETMEALFAAHEDFEKTENSVLNALFDGTTGLRILRENDWKFFDDSLSYRRLVESIRTLKIEERVDLLAIGWFGAGYYSDWPQSLAHAEEMVSVLDPKYAASYGHHWREGYAKVAGRGRLKD